LISWTQRITFEYYSLTNGPFTHDDSEEPKAHRDEMLVARAEIAKQLSIEDLSKVFYDDIFWWADQGQGWQQLDYDSTIGKATPSKPQGDC
jgi:hypothetical protein